MNQIIFSTYQCICVLTQYTSIYPWINSEIGTFIQLLCICLVLIFLCCTCLADPTYEEWGKDYGLNRITLSRNSCLPWPFGTRFSLICCSFSGCIAFIYCIPNWTCNLWRPWELEVGVGPVLSLSFRRRM